jgi:hypothetical protein
MSINRIRVNDGNRLHIDIAKVIKAMNINDKIVKEVIFVIREGRLNKKIILVKKMDFHLLYQSVFNKGFFYYQNSILNKETCT